jgi:hypothetical protein
MLTRDLPLPRYKLQFDNSCQCIRSAVLCCAVVLDYIRVLGTELGRSCPFISNSLSGTTIRMLSASLLDKN